MITRHYEVTIEVTPTVPPFLLHPLDVRESPVGKHRFNVTGYSADDAEKQALDKFHWTVPIKVLDDFELCVTVKEIADPGDKEYELAG